MLRINIWVADSFWHSSKDARDVWSIKLHIEVTSWGTPWGRTYKRRWWRAVSYVYHFVNDVGIHKNRVPW